MDIVGFTSMSKEVAPHMVMEFLNDLFSKFDEICDDYDVYKVGRERVFLRIGLFSQLSRSCFRCPTPLTASIRCPTALTASILLSSGGDCR